MKSESIQSILQYLSYSQRIILQLLCKHFYNLVIPKSMEIFSLLNENKNGFLELFKERKTVRIRRKDNLTILYMAKVKDLIESKSSNLDWDELNLCFP